MKAEAPNADHVPFEPEMVLIPAGPFLMGSDPEQDEQAHAREQPQHTLHLPDFYLAKTPLTNEQYAAFVAATGYAPPVHWEEGAPPPGKAKHPVVHVSWFDAAAYCAWLSEISGKAYRLPSEAEWEKGASWDPDASGKKRHYPWGDGFDAAHCNTKASGIGDTTPEDAYPQGASPYGLLDMAGNVYEWTLSLWGADMKAPTFGYPYDPSDGREDVQAGNGIMRVLRGGAFFHHAMYARSAHKIKSYPDYRVRTRGFRVYRDC